MYTEKQQPAWPFYQGKATLEHCPMDHTIT